MADPLVELCAEPEISEEGALDRREHLSQLLSPETVLEAQSLSSPSESDSKLMQEPLWESNLCRLGKVQWEHRTAATGAGVRELASGPC